jgi:hypothetical protein
MKKTGEVMRGQEENTGEGHERIVPKGCLPFAEDEAAHIRKQDDVNSEEQKLSEYQAEIIRDHLQIASKLKKKKAVHYDGTNEKDRERQQVEEIAHEKRPQPVDPSLHAYRDKDILFELGPIDYWGPAIEGRIHAVRDRREERHVDHLIELSFLLKDEQ